MLSRLRQRWRRLSERGSVLVPIAAGMASLLGLAALSIDVGRFTHDRRVLQNAADAAAHAGVQVLPEYPEKARTAALNWAMRNQLAFAEVSSITFGKTYTENDTIEVRTRRAAQSTFGRAVGWAGGPVTATAKATVGSITAAKGIFPFGIVDLNGPTNPGFGYSFGQKVVLREAPSNFFGPGNYGFLRVDGNGGSNIYNTLKNDGSTSWYHIGDPIDTQTGQATGPVVQGLQDWAAKFGDDWNSSRCNTWNNVHTYIDGKLSIDPKCQYRVVLIPIIDYWPNGNGTVRILGFAQMYLEQWRPGDGKRLDTIFLKDTFAHPNVEFGPINSYGTRVIKLTK
jgi:Flp pilus assembly protein TadG